jgi:hypothetical protein
MNTLVQVDGNKEKHIALAVRLGMALSCIKYHFCKEGSFMHNMADAVVKRRA